MPAWPPAWGSSRSLGLRPFFLGRQASRKGSNADSIILGDRGGTTAASDAELGNAEWQRTASREIGPDYLQ